MTGAAVGVAVLLAAAGVMRLVPASDGCGKLLSCTQRTQLSILVFLGAPVVVLLATVARLSASTRDRRLAALRLLGMSARGTRLVAAVEAGAVAAVGSAFGVPLFLLARQSLRGVELANLPHFADRLRPGGLGALLVVTGVPLLAVVVSLAPTRRVTSSPLAVARQGERRRPRLWRLVPFVAGVAMLSYGAIRPAPPDHMSSPVWFLAGTPLAGIGLPLAVPVIVRLGADLLARFARRPSMRLAARRLQLEPAAYTRVVAVLLTALLLAVGAQSVIAVFEHTPQYVEALRAETTGPQYLVAYASSPVPAAELSAVRGIRAAVPLRQAQSGHGVQAFIGTCHDLRALMPGVSTCDDRTAAWLGPPAVGGNGPIGLEASTGRGALRFTVPRPAQQWSVDQGANRISLSQSYWFSLFLPVGTPGLPSEIRTPTSWLVTADGGHAPRDRLLRVLRAHAGLADVQVSADMTALDEGRRLHATLWAATGLVLLVGFLALSLGAIDRAVERRRNVVMLYAVGVPSRVIRRSQFLQALLPIAVGVPVAGAAGLLAGHAYLAFGGETRYLPWQNALSVTVGALVIGVLLALATLPATTRRISPEHLRRE